MAVEKISTYEIGNTDAAANYDTLDGVINSYHQVSLTEMTTTTIPQIAASSIFGNNGALYRVTSNTSIGGTPTAGVNYIYFNPTTLGFTFSSTLGTWDDDKQGFYDSNNRYLLWEVYYVLTGTLYPNKTRLAPNNVGGLKMSDGFFSGKMQGFDSTAVSRNLTTSPVTDPDLETTSVSLIGNETYDLVATIYVSIQASAAQTTWALFKLIQTGGTATTKIFMQNPNTDVADGPWAYISKYNDTSFTEYYISVKAVVECQGSGTATFGLSRYKTTFGAVTITNRKIFLTGIGYSE